ncbi:hypothetical protein F441_02851 [Phytophthora nicotianae CJ01A1]|uniref:ZSWIM1/3 RNaseH-like domain-containing protein n=1 Tax=Phytophthora nicotianae CJ01A1 TaxID=1317063 RepID=W2XN54_PHYNI|nr:hypothetical protein F441_02851 [Phytophthora nicotianae CJ01A1]
MWQGGAKRTKTLRYLKEISRKPLMLKDVSNMIAKMRRNSYTSPDDNVCVMEVLQDFSESLGNLANVFRDADTKLTSCIIFQTNLMRPMTRLFPEVMCVDATHGTSINSLENSMILTCLACVNIYRLFSCM